MRFSEGAEIIPIPIVGKGYRWYHKVRYPKPIVPGAPIDAWGAGRCWGIARARELEAQENARIDDVRWPIYWCVNSDEAVVFMSRMDSYSAVDVLWADDFDPKVPGVLPASP